MLVACQECKKEVSDQASSCPHCGHPLKIAVAAPTAKARAAPVFLVLAIVAFLVALDTPRLVLFFPMMATMGFAVVSLFRREKGQTLAVLVLLCGAGLWLLNSVPSAPTLSTSSDSLNLNAAEIVDFNWHKDPKFAGKGTIKWNVQVRNKSDRNISNVKIDFTTNDASGKLVSSTFTYISAIPAGGVRSTESFADLYGTEKTANTVVSQVRFAQ